MNKISLALLAFSVFAFVGCSPHTTPAKHKRYHKHKYINKPCGPCSQNDSARHILDEYGA